MNEAIDFRTTQDCLVADFLRLQLPLAESQLQIGTLSYSLFSTEGIGGPAHGRDPLRKLALIKCIAEHFERQAMQEYFSKCFQTPNTFRNSNGWAAHFDLAAAMAASRNELLERHLLLKSFLKFGWDGFCLKHSFSIDGLEIKLLTSRFVTESRISGIAITKGQSQNGVSFGYCNGEKGRLGSLEFWKPAIFESIDKLFVLGNNRMQVAENASWIEKGIQHYLTEPLSVCLSDNSSILTPELNYCTEVFNLKSRLNLKSQFWAARTTANNAVPLFDTGCLSSDGISFVKSALENNGIDAYHLPQRHPIL